MRPSDEIDETALALLLLGGCTKCGKSFPAGTREYLCCGICYCPYCALPHTARCRHLIAYSEWGKWRIAGKLPAKLGLPRYPLVHDSTADYSPQQIADAFGSDTPYFRELNSELGIDLPLHGHDLREMLGEKRLCERLLTKILARRTRIITNDKKKGQYIFVPSADGVLERLQAAWSRLIPALERLGQKTPQATQFLHKVLQPQMDWGITCGGFSPDGTHFYVGNDAKFLLYDLETLAAKEIFERPGGYFINGTFTNNQTLALRFTHHLWGDNGRDVIYTIDTISGQAEHRITTESSMPSASVLEDGTPHDFASYDPDRYIDLLTLEQQVRTLSYRSQGTLQNGKLSVTVQTRDIFFERTEENGNPYTALLPLTITTSSLQQMAAFSPDGKHFLTVSNNKSVYVWRVTPEAFTDASRI